jgi:hypothetical protein
MKLSRICLYIIFIVSLITGIGDLAGGAASLPGATTTIAASVDSELRCLSIFWLAFGVFCFWVARNIKARGKFIPMIALVMLVSSVARLVSIIIVGMPPTILVVALVVEFVISIIIFFSYKNTFTEQQ